MPFDDEDDLSDDELFTEKAKPNSSSTPKPSSMGTQPVSHAKPTSQKDTRDQKSEDTSVPEEQNAVELSTKSQDAKIAAGEANTGLNGPKHHEHNEDCATKSH